MTTQELAQKILDCNNIAREELKDIYDNKSIAEKLCTLIDDIEKLCKEQLQQEEDIVPDDTRHDGDALVEAFRNIIAVDSFKQYVIRNVTQQEERRSITWQLFER